MDNIYVFQDISLIDYMYKLNLKGLATCTVAQNAISAFPLYICDSLDAFSLRSVQFTPAHANAILSMLFLFARYNSRLPMLMLFARCFFSSLGTIHSCPC